MRQDCCPAFKNVQWKRISHCTKKLNYCFFLKMECINCSYSYLQWLKLILACKRIIKSCGHVDNIWAYRNKKQKSLPSALHSMNHYPVCTFSRYFSCSVIIDMHMLNVTCFFISVLWIGNTYSSTTGFFSLNSTWGHLFMSTSYFISLWSSWENLGCF